MLTTNQIIAVTGVGTVLVTAVALLVTLKGVRDQLWLQTFSEWTRRYLEYVHELPAAARNPDGTFTLDTVDGQARERLLNAVRAYLNLCSEEHYLHSRGKIDHKTWQIWVRGMEDAFEAAWFRAVWQELRHEYRHYGDFCSFFDGCSTTAMAAASSGPRDVPAGVAAATPAGP